MATMTTNNNNKTPSSKQYLASLQAGVKRGSYPINKITQETVSTGRNIPQGNTGHEAWKGHWPILREFLQNTVDHLHLLDPTTGRLHPALKMIVDVTTEETKTTFYFVIREDDGDDDERFSTAVFEIKDERVVCIMAVQPDCVVIEQRYTFPMAPRALETGVPDICKQSSTSHAAGGFGDGFKTAATALLAQDSNEKASLTWEFYYSNKGIHNTHGSNRPDRQITWSFQKAKRKQISTFAEGSVLQVQIKPRPVTANKKKSNRFFQFKARSVTANKNKSNGLLSSPPQRNHVMRQIIESKDIGMSFLEKVVPRFQVFWSDAIPNDPNCFITSREHGRGDCLAHAATLPAVAGGFLWGSQGNLVKPRAGVYVRGIWVRKPKIKGTVMSFLGDSLTVLGRDRNDVDYDQLVTAVANVLEHTPQKQVLKTLLESLRGTGETSWLLASPAFHDQILHKLKDYILHDIFDIPRGAIFVSEKVKNNSEDLFVKWATCYLEQKGAPLVSIGAEKSDILFTEAGRSELEEQCAKFLLKETGHDPSNNNSSSGSSNMGPLAHAVQRLLACVGVFQVGVLALPSVEVPFYHDDHVFLPCKHLSSNLLKAILTMLGQEIWKMKPSAYYTYMCFICTLVQNLPDDEEHELTMEELDRAIARTKVVAKKTLKYMSSKWKTSSSTSRDTKNTEESIASKPMSFGEKITEKIKNFGTDLSKKNGDFSIQGGNFFGMQSAGSSEWHGGSYSALKNVMVDESLGGGYILCDSALEKELLCGSLTDDSREQIRALRAALSDAITIVGNSVPALEPILEAIHHGYDSLVKGGGYMGYCQGDTIVVNLYEFKKYQHSNELLHQLITTVAHEVAHYFEPKDGHGNRWYDFHMDIMVRVMEFLHNFQEVDKDVYADEDYHVYDHDDNNSNDCRQIGAELIKLGEGFTNVWKTMHQLGRVVRQSVEEDGFSSTK